MVVKKGSYTYNFPNKGGTIALTSDYTNLSISTTTSSYLCAVTPGCTSKSLASATLYQNYVSGVSTYCGVVALR